MLSPRNKRASGRLREPFGKAGLAVAVIALVFAMFGGAYAASKDNGGGKATASAKKGPRGPRGPKGATGPAGPAGPQGPAGAKGDTGVAGSNGSNGTNGTSAEAVSFAGSEHGCTEGGIEVKSAKPSVFICNGKKGTNGTSAEAVSFAGSEHGCTEGGIEVKSAKPTVFVCNGKAGKDGEPWVAGTAPDNVVLKGTWAIPYYNAAAGGERIPAAISTGVPIPAGAGAYFGFTKGVTYASAEEQGFAELLCPGTAEEPTINTAFADNELGEAGVVCVYALTATNLTSPGFEAITENWGPMGSGGGVVANFKSSAAGVAKGSGSWALYTK